MFLSRGFLVFEWVVNMAGLKLQTLSFLWWAAAEISVEVILVLSELLWSVPMPAWFRSQPVQNLALLLCGSPFQSFPLHFSAAVKVMKPVVWVLKPVEL